MADDTHAPGPDPAVPPPRLKAGIAGVNTVFRQCLALLGLLMIAVAAPLALVTPLVPVGLPLAIIGVLLLGRNAVWGRRWMERVLERHPRIERSAPNWLMQLVFARDKRDL